MIQTLKLEDWDRRVRISASNYEGARVGSVAQVPPLGVKLALRGAMLDRARAEIEAILAQDSLRVVKLNSRIVAWVWFTIGAGTAGAIAIALRVAMG